MIPMPPNFDDPWKIKTVKERTQTWPLVGVFSVFFILLAYFFDLIYTAPGTSPWFIIVLGVWGIGLIITGIVVLSTPLKTTEIKTQKNDLD